MLSAPQAIGGYDIIHWTNLLRMMELARRNEHEIPESGGRRRNLSGGSAGSSDRNSPTPSLTSVGSWDTPSSPGASGARAGRTNLQRYKTELCRQFVESGSCKYGDKCQFAHGTTEMRNVDRHPKYKTDLCRNFNTTGFCPYGPRCHFVHNEEERRAMMQAAMPNLVAPGLLPLARPILAAVTPAPPQSSEAVEERLQELAVALSRMSMTRDLSAETWQATQAVSATPQWPGQQQRCTRQTAIAGL